MVADPSARADNLTGGVGFPGARDAQPFEAQAPYVRTFSSGLLSEPVEWTGAVHAVLFATVSAQQPVLSLCRLLVFLSAFRSRRKLTSHWQYCHFADALSPSLLIHLLKVEGGCSRTTVSSMAEA